MADAEEIDLVKKLAAKTVFSNPANQQNMAVPQQNTPVQQNPSIGLPPELADSSFAPTQHIQPKMYEDDGLGGFDKELQEQLKPSYPTPKQNPPPQSYQQPTNHQAVFPPDLQGAILRKLSTIEKAVLATAEKVNSIQKQLDVWEKRIEFKDEDEQ